MTAEGVAPATVAGVAPEQSPDDPERSVVPPGGRLRSLASRVTSAGYVDLLFAQAVPLGVSFLLTLVSASLLGPERRGVLTFLMTASLLFGALAYGSLHVPVVDGLRSRDQQPLRHGARVAAGLWGLMSAAGLAVVVGVRLTHGDWTLRTPASVGWGLVGGGLVVAQLFASRVLQGIARNREYQLVVVAQSVLYLLGAGGVLLLTRSPALMFAAWYASVLVSVAAAAVLLCRQVEPGSTGPPAAGSFRRFLRSAMANNVGSIGQMVMLRADVLVVTLVCGPAAAGVYGMALSLTELALIGPEVFSLSVFANRARMTFERWERQLGRTLRIAAVTSVAAMVVIALAAVVLTRGPLQSYTGLVTLVLIILPGTFFAGYSRVALGGLQALNASSTVWRFGVLALVLAVAYLPGAALAGPAGAAVASTVAYAATALFLRRGLKMRLRSAAR